jgi:hypothetical protein
VQQRQHLAFDQRAVPNRMLGLDEDLHRPVPVQNEGNERIQRQQAGITVRTVRTPAVVPRTVLELA